jgi:transglutaminase-like putative cysteine protease
MLLKLTHTTDLNYSEPISESVMELRVAPRQAHDQHRLSFSLAVGPPTSVSSYFDWLGNTVHFFTINRFHQQIRIVATSVVETDRVRPEPQQLSDTWPVALGEDDRLFDFLQFGGPVVDAPAVRALAAELLAERGLPLGELAMRMLRLIGDRFVYEQGVTTSASPITELLEHGKGVCQDFTHLLIGLARAMGIPARYVSGLIHPEGTRLRGYTQTHAWCELMFPSIGWVGFDPANNCTIGANFVRVAIGRDFRDVPPNKGMYRGGAAETIKVEVHSEELTSIPPELAAERIQPLELPAHAVSGTHQPQRVIAQQQEQQQQG